LSWQQSHTSSGTVWLVVDQSPSMQSSDAQATAAERLRWAEGLGMIARRKGELRPDDLQARVHAAADELAALAPEYGEGDEGAAIRAFAVRVSAWSSDLGTLMDSVRAAKDALNGYSPDSGKDALGLLED